MWNSFIGTSTTSRKDIEKDRRERREKRDKERQMRNSPRSAEKDKEPRNRTPTTSTSRRKGSTAKEKDRERDSEPKKDKKTSGELETDSSTSSNRKMSIVPEMERRSSGSLTNSAANYPGFSKKHSKEAVSTRDNTANPRLNPYTPDPTDLDSEQRDRATPERRQPPVDAPPSPPLTTTDVRRPRSQNGSRKSTSHIRIVSPPRKVSLERGIYEKNDPTRTGSSSTLRRRAHSDTRSGSPRSKRSTPRNLSREDVSVTESDATETEVTSSTYDDRSRGPGAQSTAGKSDATYTSTGASTATDSTVEPPKHMVPPRSKGLRPAPIAVSEPHSSPVSAPDSSPRTPTPHDSRFPPTSDSRTKPQVIEVAPTAAIPSPYSMQSEGLATPSSAGILPPPPPPPPVNANISMPRVDYLLQNGGLPHLVPKRFTSVLAPITPQSTQYPNYVSPRAFGPQHTDVRTVFAPLQGVLDSYLQVMNKNGSLAVATGYRSVARRLLDRLEAVFNRNISSEACDCIMCVNSSNESVISEEEDTGISWGEILEYVSGRKELPSWPPFSIETDAPTFTMSPEAPMQKLDIDVPPEYRDHYIRQSKRTKDAVQGWLAAQPEMRSSPPQEVDDETLMFAMITHLEPENRKLFTALLRGMSTLPASRAPTPAERPKSELIKRTSLAVQRMYRLQQPPRDAECAIFLLRNPDLHSVLATIAAISQGEWDILISGRFDGFLWSGADETPSRGPTPAQRGTPGLPSRGPTPAEFPSRGPTPGFGAAVPAPVQMDEDTEIAVLAEVEREIYAGMDALEDAFEALHARAEEVRAALRLRNSGLSVAASRRRGSSTPGPEAVAGTPSTAGYRQGAGAMMWGAGAPDDFDWNDDGRSEILPDDSASNISYNRRRRKKREKERRETPALVEEEEDEVEDVAAVAERRGSTRRR